MTSFQSFSLSHKDVERKWLLIDATNLVIGRLASVVAKLLRGKHKPTFTPHIDCGDNVIIINSARARFTGNKENRKSGKFYYSHSGYPGGLKTTTAGELFASGKSEQVLKYAIRRMMTRKNKISAKQLGHLFVYPDANHKHEAQKPEIFDFASMNPKNTIRS